MGGRRAMAISVLLSTVSDEFRSYRDLLVHDLTRHNVAVKMQEDFNDLGGNMLDTSPIATRSCISWAIGAAPRRALSDHDRRADACDLSQSPATPGRRGSTPRIRVVQGPVVLSVPIVLFEATLL